MNKNIGSNFDITNTLLGNGSYGKVYLANDERNNKYAVKCCDIEVDGIPNILEVIIMNSIYHNYINNALLITVTDKKLYIFQELAIMDLAHKTRKHSNINENLADVKKWCHSLSLAISCLHNQNIIHCDIKANNVLLFEDNNIKLTDFTLAIKQWNKNETFNHNVCTRTHRPLECFLNEEWDKSLDIWSLGCTFYEIAYGELLFVDQKNKKQAFINALLYWGYINDEEKYKTISPLKNDENIVEFIKPKMFTPLLFSKTEENLFKDLLNNMLVVDKSKRYTIEEVLNHKFFETPEINNQHYYKVQKLKNNKLQDKEELLAKINIFDDITKNIIIYIYNLCHDLNINNNLKLEVCVLIASKINTKILLKNFFTFDKDEIISTEKEICHHLNFKLLDF